MCLRSSLCTFLQNPSWLQGKQVYSTCCFIDTVHWSSAHLPEMVSTAPTLGIKQHEYICTILRTGHLVLLGFVRNELPLVNPCWLFPPPFWSSVCLEVRMTALLLFRSSFLPLWKTHVAAAVFQASETSSKCHKLLKMVESDLAMTLASSHSTIGTHSISSLKCPIC